MALLRPAVLLILVCAGLVVGGCKDRTKPADISDNEYLQRLVTDEARQNGLDVADIRVRSPKLARTSWDAEGRITQLQTVEGTYDVSFRSRLAGTDAEWQQETKHYRLSYTQGKWTAEEVSSPETQ